MENKFNENMTSVNKTTLENKTENMTERNWANLTSTDLIELLDKLESFEDEDGNLKKMPELIVDGKLDKDTLAALMTYKAPLYVTANKETAAEIINFLIEINSKLNNQTLANTIDSLQDESEYLNTVKEISEKAFKDLEDTKSSGDADIDFENIKRQIDTQHNATQANLLRFTAGRLFMEKVSKTYDGLWNEYLAPKEFVPKAFVE